MKKVFVLMALSLVLVVDVMAAPGIDQGITPATDVIDTSNTTCAGAHGQTTEIKGGSSCPDIANAGEDVQETAGDDVSEKTISLKTDEFICSRNDLIGRGNFGLMMTRFWGSNRLFITAGGDWIINQTGYVGLKIFRLVSATPYANIQDTAVGLTFTGGGLEFGYIQHVSQSVEVNVQLLLGMTSIFYKDPLEHYFTGNDVMLIEPGIYAGMRVSSWMQTRIGISYRYHLGVRGVEEFEKNAFDGLALEVTTDFGAF